MEVADRQDDEAEPAGQCIACPGTEDGRNDVLNR